jgi:hypothetical protein
MRPVFLVGEKQQPIFSGEISLPAKNLYFFACIYAYKYKKWAF